MIVDERRTREIRAMVQMLARGETIVPLREKKK